MGECFCEDAAGDCGSLVAFVLPFAANKLKILVKTSIIGPQARATKVSFQENKHDQTTDIASIHATVKIGPAK
jgi:hypothetical protein